MLAPHELKTLQHKIAYENDQHAFAQLYISGMPFLLQFAHSIIKNKELAEEIVSDVFIKIWQKRADLKEVDNFKLYLYVSTKNTALNYLSRHFRKDTISLEEMSLNITAGSYNPEQLMVTSEIAKRIDEEIQKLPNRCKLIFKLVKEDGLRYNDIASLLNISVKTIDNQMAIALKKIAGAINFQLKKTSQHS
ncbi:MAG: RNA polymerase sigma-70 factor [Bacteroidetes bacterium]|nr:RNA polymerase sigma-70 factor [Bacteroidota bacterium]